MELDESNVLLSGFISRKQDRGKGFGNLLLKAFDQQHQGKNTFLSSALPMVPLYQKKGYKDSDPPMNIVILMIPLKKNFDEVFRGSDEGICTVKDCDSCLKKKLEEYDANFHPFERKQLLRIHLEKCEIIKIAFNDEGVVCGYGCLRKNFDGYCVTPLYAEDKRTATKLLHDLVKNVPDGTLVKVVICDGNGEASGVMQNLGYDPENPEASVRRMFVARRMFSQEDSPIAAVTKVYSTMNVQYSLF